MDISEMYLKYGFKDYQDVVLMPGDYIAVVTGGRLWGPCMFLGRSPRGTLQYAYVDRYSKRRAVTGFRPHALFLTGANTDRRIIKLHVSNMKLNEYDDYDAIITSPIMDKIKKKYERIIKKLAAAQQTSERHRENSGPVNTSQHTATTMVDEYVQLHTTTQGDTDQLLNVGHL